MADFLIVNCCGCTFHDPAKLFHWRNPVEIRDDVPATTGDDRVAMQTCDRRVPDLFNTGGTCIDADCTCADDGGVDPCGADVLVCRRDPTGEVPVVDPEVVLRPEECSRHEVGVELARSCPANGSIRYEGPRPEGSSAQSLPAPTSSNPCRTRIVPTRPAMVRKACMISARG